MARLKLLRVATSLSAVVIPFLPLGYSGAISPKSIRAVSGLIPKRASTYPLSQYVREDG
ncbi:MAG: hypothetical protein ACM65K_02870 [Microcoleus sp.]